MTALIAAAPTGPFVGLVNAQLSLLAAQKNPLPEPSEGKTPFATPVKGFPLIAERS